MVKDIERMDLDEFRTRKIEETESIPDIKLLNELLSQCNDREAFNELSLDNILKREATDAEKFLGKMHWFRTGIRSFTDLLYKMLREGGTIEDFIKAAGTQGTPVDIFVSSAVSEIIRGFMEFLDNQFKGLIEVIEKEYRQNLDLVVKVEDLDTIKASIGVYETYPDKPKTVFNGEKATKYVKVRHAGGVFDVKVFQAFLKEFEV